MLEKVREKIQNVPISCEALKFGAVCAAAVPVPTAILTLILDIRVALPGSSLLGGLTLFGHSLLTLFFMALPFIFALLSILKNSKWINYAAVLFCTVIGVMNLICLDFMSAMPALVVALCLLGVYVKEYYNGGE